MITTVPNAEKTVLIVEDDEVLLRALYLMFHSEGYTVASATDGETALETSIRLRPAIVLLDLILPKLSGIDFLKTFKSHTELKDIPVVVLSNLGDTATIENAKTLGAIDYYIKSDTDISVLYDKVKKYL